jgi:energy-coupling factor transporter transmembrane protein EcfT
MKDLSPKLVHESYQRHRRQRTSQIILPIILAALLFIGMVVFINIATFSYNGDVGRWAAISTIWLSIPVCLMGFVFLALLAGMVYLLGRLLGIAPIYTNQAQNFVQKLAIRIRLIADKLVKPVISVNSFGASVKALLGRK